MRMGMFLSLPMACIWFGESMGGFVGGTMRGQFISSGTPGCMVTAGGRESPCFCCPSGFPTGAEPLRKITPSGGANLGARSPGVARRARAAPKRKCAEDRAVYFFRAWMPMKTRMDAGRLIRVRTVSITPSGSGSTPTVSASGELVSQVCRSLDRKSR